jgi:hypothetical protein
MAWRGWAKLAVGHSKRRKCIIVYDAASGEKITQFGKQAMLWATLAGLTVLL